MKAAGEVGARWMTYVCNGVVDDGKMTRGVSELVGGSMSAKVEVIRCHAVHTGVCWNMQGQF